MSNKTLDKIINRIISHLGEKLLEKYPQYKELKNKQLKLERALTAAKQTQKAILPKGQPKLENYDIHWRFKPYYQVSGDYCDYMNFDGNKLGLVIADVSGKGLEAALLTHSIHAALDVLARNNKTGEISDIIYKLNNFIQKHTPDNKFATLIYGELDKEENFNYCNVGHEPLLLYSRGNVTEIKNSDLLLGFIKDTKYNNFSLKLNKNDILLLYSDGVANSIGKKGTKLLGNILRKYHNEKASRISNKIYDALDKYKQLDDQTTIIVKYKL